MLQFYGYKNCSSCRNAENLLIQENVSYEFIDITLHPPAAKKLEELWKHSALDLKKFLNTHGEVYRSLGLKDTWVALSPKEQLGLLAGNGRLIKRPLITDGKKVTLGFRPEELKIWTQASN